MYEIRHYVDANDCGTATLLEALARNPVGRLVVASSMSVYGEGLMRDAAGALHESASRSDAQLQAGTWDPVDGRGRALEPVATPEWKRTNLRSVYAVCKHAQEQLCLSAGAAYDMQPVALRFFNVYGPRQALSNPYTGVLAIFASRLLNGRPPLIYEDGRQRRDFVHVRDVARACRAALEREGVGGAAYNVGSGASVTIREIADDIARALGKNDLTAEVTGRFRVGDIRHCFADTAVAERSLGFRAEEPWDAGIAELAEWVAGQVADDKVEAANRELARRGLVA
jgi:dTDP-L-rhamnose 4-epimerase